jgi:transposase
MLPRFGGRRDKSFILPMEAMKTMSTTRRTYSSEFKREAVELAARSGRSIAEVERELGLSEGLLKQWIRKAKQDGEAAFPGPGRLKATDEELRRLRRENEILRQERDILKKAIGIFTQEPKRSTPS